MSHIQHGGPPQNYARSLWIDTADTTDYPALDRDLTADAVVAGGGGNGSLTR